MSLRRSLLSTAALGALVIADLTSGALPASLSHSRASNAMAYDSAGNLVYAPNNLIRNNSMAGAAAGTPGTLPNNWSTFTSATGITRTIVGVGVETGLAYIDVRVAGTPSASTPYTIYFEPNTGISAITGQIIAGSSYFKIAAGSATNLSGFLLGVDENTSGGAYVTGGNFATFTPTGTLSRVSGSRLFSGGATVGAALPYVRFTFTSGQPCDITIRIALPQLSLVTAAQSTIPDMPATTSAAYYGPRFDYDPTTLAAKGLLLEGSRTNSIRNSTFQGAVAGDPELVSNRLMPGEGLGITGWTTTTTGGGTGIVSAHSGGGLDIAGSASGVTYAYMPISVVAGSNYSITLTNATNAVSVSVGSNASPTDGVVVNGFSLAAGVTTSVQFTAGATTTFYLAFSRTTGATASTITNVSVRKTLVTNGDFALNPINASVNVVQNGWQWGASGSSTVTYSSGAVVCTGDGTNAASLTGGFSGFVIGTTYTVIVDVSGNAGNIAVGTAAYGAQNLSASTVLGVGTGQVFQFTATATTHWLTLFRTPAGGMTIDNVRVYSAGVLPTNYARSVGSGIFANVEALGTSNGRPYIDVRVFGTSTGGTTAGIVTDGSAVTAAVNGQFWALSSTLALVGGTQANIGALYLAQNMANSGGSFLASLGSGSPITLSATPTRYVSIQTLNNASTAFIYAALNVQVNSASLTVDVTVRMMLYQLEQLASASQTASSPILTFGSALTRSADICTITGAGANVLAAAQGSVVVETVQSTNAPGINARLIGASSSTPLYVGVSGTPGSVALSTSGVIPSWTTGARAGVAFDQAGKSLAATGSTLGKDTSPNAWSGPSFWVGSGNGSSTADGWYTKLAFYSRRLTDTELAAKVVLGTGL